MDLNIAAPVNQTGYGIVGTNLVLTLQKLGHSPALWCTSPMEVAPRYIPGLKKAIDRTGLFNPKAPSLRCSQQFDLAQHAGKGLQCGFPIFELTRFMPQELHHLKIQDLLFVTSRWAGQILQDNGIPAERIRYAPLGVDRTIFSPRQMEQASASPTIFMNVGKWEIRKGHDFLHHAFQRAFMPKDNVRLIMVCHNLAFLTHADADCYNRKWRDMYLQSPLRDKIVIASEKYATQDDLANMMAGADCGVFPARAEGWNLDLCEMMAMGKHIIATNYSAHTEYLSEANARLIAVDKLTNAHDGLWFDSNRQEWNGKPGQWAELGARQMEQLIQHMRDVHRLKQEGKLASNQAGINAMQKYTWENTAEAIIGALQ